MPCRGWRCRSQTTAASLAAFIGCNQGSPCNVFESSYFECRKVNHANSLDVEDSFGQVTL
jgi:hypothetical protein